MGDAMNLLTWLTQFLEYLGGSRDNQPPGFPVAVANPVFWGLWWGALSLVIYIFCGQSSKFIYIDF
jgi:hypothetical protein